MSVVKNGFPVPAAKITDAALLEVADRAAADVGLGDLGHGHRRENAGVDPDPLERVLEGEGVQHRRQHPHVVGGGAVHALRGALEAAVDVAGADDDRDLDAPVADLAHLARDPLDLGGIGAVFEVAHQRLARELQQDPLEAGLGPRLYSPPTSKRAKRAIRTFSPVFAARSVLSSSIVLPS